jgi:hypothetical protein
MAELEIHHEGNENDPLGKTVGVLAAVLAVMLAIVSIAAERTHTDAVIQKSEANDHWAYYQANSIKLHNVEASDGLLTVLNAKGDAVDRLRAKWQDQNAKYKKERDDEHEAAEKSDKITKADENRAFRYDVGRGLLEIGLVLSSLYFISKKKMFPVMGVLAGIAGVGFAIWGVMI